MESRLSLEMFADVSKEEEEGDNMSFVDETRCVVEYVSRERILPGQVFRLKDSNDSRKNKNFL